MEALTGTETLLFFMKKKQQHSNLLLLCWLLERCSSSSVASLLEKQAVHCVALHISSIFIAAAVTMLFFFVQFIMITCAEQSDSSVNEQIVRLVSVSHRVSTYTYCALFTFSAYDLFSFQSSSYAGGSACWYI